MLRRTRIGFRFGNASSLLLSVRWGSAATLSLPLSHKASCLGCPCGLLARRAVTQPPASGAASRSSSQRRPERAAALPRQQQSRRTRQTIGSSRLSGSHLARGPRYPPRYCSSPTASADPFGPERASHGPVTRSVLWEAPTRQQRPGAAGGDRSATVPIMAPGPARSPLCLEQRDRALLQWREFAIARGGPAGPRDPVRDRRTAAPTLRRVRTAESSAPDPTTALDWPLSVNGSLGVPFDFRQPGRSSPRRAPTGSPGSLVCDRSRRPSPPTIAAKRLAVRHANSIAASRRRPVAAAMSQYERDAW